jgi:hypothetical protein
MWSEINQGYCVNFHQLDEIYIKKLDSKNIFKLFAQYKDGSCIELFEGSEVQCQKKYDHIFAQLNKDI